MKIHEYQGKQLFKRFGIPVPVGEPALSIDDALGAVPRVQRQSGVETVVVKAQIHAGGRGKGGGVKVCKTDEEAEKAIRAIFGMQLVTAQTGPEGKKVQRLLIEQGLDIEKEFYFAITLDRAAGRVTIMASAEGGMDIEEVAAKHPEKIHRAALHPALGFQDHQGRRLGFRLGLDSKQVAELTRMLAALSRMYDEMDCALVEVNPLVLLKDGHLVALDAKVTFDDNALERHPELRDWRDPSEEDPAETEAKRHDLSYINLDGNIGCMVNGAGLAMATMDIIQHYGGRPANFLDVGGGATTEKVTAAFKIITRDPAVKGIFVNIFGGIMKCDTIANGIITAVKEVGLSVPLVVRLEGTNVELGKKLLQESGLNLYAAADMADGARKIAELAGGAKGAGR
jgi:succinyl-CoA synthetase beta subunit